MAEYIEKEKLVDGLDKTLKNIPSFPSDPIGRELVALGIETVIKTVKALPAADVRPVVKAHFNLVDGYSITALGYDIKGLECSNCGATFIAQTWIKKFKFCPNCGARMEES